MTLTMKKSHLKSLSQAKKLAPAQTPQVAGGEFSWWHRDCIPMTAECASGSPCVITGACN